MSYVRSNNLIQNINDLHNQVNEIKELEYLVLRKIPLMITHPRILSIKVHLIQHFYPFIE